MTYVTVQPQLLATAAANVAARPGLVYRATECAHPVRATGDIRHEAKLSLVPNFLGQFHLRHSDLDGNKLNLSAELPLTDGRTVYPSLVWARAGQAGSQVA